MPAEDVRVDGTFTINKYTITFESNGGSQVAAITQDYNTSVSAPTEPTRTGYTFVGWTPSVPATMPAENITLTANWTINSYNVFYYVDGVLAYTDTYDYNEVVTPRANESKVGYTFSGWTTIPTNMPAEDVRVDGTFTVNIYTITFDSNEGSVVENQSVQHGGKVTEPTKPTKEGYSFVEWQLNGSKYDFETVVTGPITLVAKWEEKSSSETVEQTATLSFSSTANRTSFSTSQQIWSQDKIILTNNKGSSTSNVSDYSNPARFYKSSNLIIACTTMTKIEFNCNSPAYATALKDSIASNSNYTVAVSGKVVTVTFVESVDKFSIDSLTGGQVRMDSLSVTYILNDDNEEPDIPEIDIYTITFDSNEGSVVENQSVQHGGKVTEPTKPTKEGYSFVEWQLNGSKYDFETVVTGPITLVAKWEEKSSSETVEQTATLSFSSTANRTSFSTSQQIWSQDKIILTNNKGSSTSNVSDYSNPARFYKSSNLIIACTTMTKIEFNCNSPAYATALKDSIASNSNYTVAVSGKVVTVTFVESVDKFSIDSLTGGQVRMDSLVVTYVE